MSRDDLVTALKCDLQPENVDGVRSFRWTLASIPKGSTAAIGSPNAGSASFTPDVEGSYLIELVINEGLTGQVLRLIAAVRFAEVTIGSFTGRLRLPAAGEDLESNWQSDFGFGPQLNTTGWWETLFDWLHAMQQAIDIGAVGGVVPLSRQVIAGAGLVGGGDFNADRTVDVVAGDGSISVGVNSISVGVLVSDAQHGSLGGAFLHTLAVAGGDSGFISGADKTRLDSAIDGARTLTAGSGLTGGGNLSADRTFNVIAHADGSVVSNANDIQVGILATDAQHGDRGGASQHALATPSVPGFMSAADKVRADSSVLDPRSILSGAGIVGGGDLSADRTLDVGAHADGSISVNSDDIQVGVLATDGQHGVRGGGTQHALATGGAAGFMSASDKTLLGTTVDESRTITAGSGLTGGGDLSVNRTINVIPNGDGSILANPNDVQVGILATDGQHGDRGGGTQHTLATTSASGFMSAGDKTKADSSVLQSRTIIAGAGLTGGGNLSADRTVNVIANADGSLVANADDVQVGVLASDGQHGLRGGGTQHALATGLVAGFMSPGDKVKANNSVQESRTVVAGDGLTGGGTLAGDVTISAVPHADGSIAITPNTIQVGILADDGQHGDRGGGDLHANATISVAGFMSASDKVKADNSVQESRTVTAGSGLTGGGALSSNITINAVAHADGSIAVASDSVQVGILATDGQHGARGGGTQHTLATGSVSGFMSGADKTLLDAAVPSSRSITAGAGLTGGGTLSANRTVDVAAGDGSISVFANSIQVGVISDTQHGARGGGSRHTLVTTSQHGFMSATDKTKIDSVATGATNDHGALSGLGDAGDHTWAALTDGSRDITGTQQFNVNVGLDSPSPNLIVGDGTGNPDVIIDKGASFNTAELRFREFGSDRWFARMDTVGNLQFGRYNSSAVFQGIPLELNASTGDAVFSGDITLDSPAATLTIGDGSSPGTSKAVIVRNSVSPGDLRFESDEGGGVQRQWVVSNTSSNDFQISRHNETTGALIDQPIFISHSSGDVTLGNNVTLDSDDPALTFGNGLGTTNVFFRKESSGWNEIEYFSDEGGGQQRQWMIQHTNANDFRISRRDSLTGGFIDSVLEFDHGDGHLVTANNVIAGGQSYSGSSSSTVVSNAVTLDFNNGNIVKFDGQGGGTGTITITLDNMENGGSYLALFRRGTTARALIFQAPGRTVQWEHLSSPTTPILNNKEQMYRFIVHDVIAYGKTEWRDQTT